MKNTTGILELPTNYPRPSIQSGRGKNCNFKLNDNLIEKINKFMNTKNISLFMYSLSCLYVLL